MNNVTANKFIKDLYKTSKRGAIRKDIVEQGYQALLKINEPKNYYVINSFLKLCQDYKYPEKALCIDNDIQTLINKSDDILDNKLSYPLLINVYGQCSVHNATDIFNTIYQKNNKMIDNSIIGAMMNVYIQNNQADKALDLYDTNGSHNNDLTHNLAIKACTKSLNLKKGQQIHENLEDSENIQIKNSLINLYGACQDINSAISIFNSIDSPDIVTYNTIFDIYINNNDNASVLKLYKEIKLAKDDRCHMLAIQACINKRDFDTGQDIISTLRDTSQEKEYDIKLETSFIKFYANFNQISKAKDIFNCIPQNRRSITCNNAMLQACLDCGNYEDVIMLYDTIKPSKRNPVTHSLAITACINANDYKHGKSIIQGIDVQHLQHHLIKSCLMEFYGHFGKIEDAKNIFGTLLDSPNFDSSNALSMMRIYCRNHHYKEALELYHNFAFMNFDGNEYHSLVIKCCSNINELNLLLLLFCSHFDVEMAVALFYEIMKYDDNDDNESKLAQYMLGIYSNYIPYDSRALLYRKLGIDINKDDDYEDINFLTNKLCSILDYKRKEQVTILSEMKDKTYHTEQSIMGLIECYQELVNLMSTMEMDKRCELIIESVMRILLEYNSPETVLHIYDRIITDDKFEWMNHNLILIRLDTLAIKACTKLGDINKGQQIHTHGINIDNGYNNIAFKTSLIDFYGSHNDIINALEIFNSIDDKYKNIVIVNAMLNVYAKNNKIEECMNMLRKYQSSDHLKHDVIFYTILLSACANVGHFLYGKEVHDLLRKDQDKQWILNHHEITTNLINFYGKCGVISECEEIFKTHKHDNDVIIWNAMIHSYGINGDIDNAVQLFDDMNLRQIGPSPDQRTYIHLINAYSHVGNVNDAIKTWESINDKDIKFDDYILSVITDCMSRKGDLKQAFEFVTKHKIMNQVAWISIMSGCKKYDQQELALAIFENMLTKFDHDASCVTASCKMFPNFSNIQNK